MTRFFLFISFILAYSAIGLVAASQHGPTKVATSGTNVAVTNGTNVTVMYKTSTSPVVRSLVVERCAVADCSNAISI